MPEIVVASFNVHAGVDGWGRPYDAVAACRELAADVLVLQENFAPGAGGGDGGLAGEVAGRLGYTAVTRTLAPARLYPPVEGRQGFGPPVWARRPVGLRIVPPRPGRRGGGDGGVPGTWGLAVLSRPPVVRFEDLDLGDLPRDPAHRRALVVDLDVGGHPLAVIGVHMSHISDGSPAQLRRLARLLPPPAVSAVVAGDMNMWGPPLRLLLPGWRRAVRGRTWPAPRPLAQLDHLLVRPSTEVLEAGVLRLGASDHRAVRARLRLG